MNTPTISRRAALGMALAGVTLPGGLGARQESAGQRRMEGASRGDGEKFVPRRGELFTTPYDNDPFIREVETKLKCTCGCLHNVYECRLTDFTCSFWPNHHASIVEQATGGWTADEIIAAYVQEYGAEYLMAPAAAGFNLIAYVLPGALIATAGALLAVYLRRSHRLAVASGAVGVDVGTGTDLSEEAQRMLEEELQNLDT